MLVRALPIGCRSSSDFVGPSFGALFTGYLSNTFGRKPILILSGIIYLVGSLIQALIGLGMDSNAALKLFYFSRFFAGIGVGMVSALVPSYVSECVPKAIRGRCTGMVQLANNIGIMLSCKHLYSTGFRNALLIHRSLGQLRRQHELRWN